MGSGKHCSLGLYHLYLLIRDFCCHDYIQRFKKKVNSKQTAASRCKIWCFVKNKYNLHLLQQMRALLSQTVYVRLSTHRSDRNSNNRHHRFLSVANSPACVKLTLEGFLQPHSLTQTSIIFDELERGKERCHPPTTTTSFYFHDMLVSSLFDTNMSTTPTGSDTNRSKHLLCANSTETSSE